MSGRGSRGSEFSNQYILHEEEHKRLFEDSRQSRYHTAVNTVRPAADEQEKNSVDATKATENISPDTAKVAENLQTIDSSASALRDMYMLSNPVRHVPDVQRAGVKKEQDTQSSHDQDSKADDCALLSAQISDHGSAIDGIQQSKQYINLGGQCGMPKIHAIKQPPCLDGTNLVTESNNISCLQLNPVMIVTEFKISVEDHYFGAELINNIIIVCTKVEQQNTIEYYPENLMANVKVKLDRKYLKYLQEARQYLVKLHKGMERFDKTELANLLLNQRVSQPHNGENTQSEQFRIVWHGFYISDDCDADSEEIQQSTIPSGRSVIRRMKKKIMPVHLQQPIAFEWEYSSDSSTESAIIIMFSASENNTTCEGEYTVMVARKRKLMSRKQRDALRKKMF